MLLNHFDAQDEAQLGHRLQVVDVNYVGAQSVVQKVAQFIGVPPARIIHKLITSLLNLSASIYKEPNLTL